jgi:hypothetical protein
LELKMQADRRVGVIVNGKMAFTLFPTLGAVLSILCSYSTAAKASNVPATYLDYAMISARLCAVAGSRPPSVHVVVNYIYRLRAAFEAHKFDPTFIRRAPHLGVRLVLSSRAPAQTASIDAIATIGCGDLVNNRLLSAQRRLAADGLLRRVAYLDLPATCPVPFARSLGMDPAYFPVRSGSRLPAAELRAGGWLRPSVLWYIATPTEFHTHYAWQLLDTGCRVTVEKPLTQHPEEAEDLLDVAAGTLFSIGHQLFKRTMLDFLATCRLDDLLWASAVGFDLMETQDIGKRAIDDAIWDLGWHGFEVMRAAFRAAGAQARMWPTEVRVATYQPPAGEPAPARFTAARIEGYLEARGRTVPIVIRVGKGLAQTARRLVFFDAAGCVHQEVSLAESGWEAHYRLLRELLTASQPDMRLGLAETLDVVRACRAATALATHTEPYAFGTTPPFLERAQPSNVSFVSRPAHAQRSAFTDIPVPTGSPVMAVTAHETGCDESA